MGAVYVGAVNALNDVFNFSDVTNALMCIPNLTAMFVLNSVVAKETSAFFKGMKKNGTAPDESAKKSAC